MKSRSRIVISALVFFAPLLAREKTDVIVMKNGDRLTGEIKSLASGVLRFDLDYVDGAISVQWLKVARVETKQLFIVQTEDGAVYTGMLMTSSNAPSKIRILQVTETAVEIEQARIVKLDETAKHFLKRLSGEISVGAVYSKGNNATQYNLASDVEYRRERWGVQMAISSNLSANSGSDTTTWNQTTISGYHMLPWKNYFYGGLGDFLQSSVQGIHLQTSIGGGLGRFLKNSSRARWSLLGGLAWQRAKYTNSTGLAPTQEVVAGLFATNLQLFVFKKTNLSLNGYVTPTLNESGRIHVSTNASYYLKIFKNFSWNFSFYGNWDTQPPHNFSGSDYGYSSGLKWTFGTR